MGSITAQIMVGSPHPNHGGIIPSHFLFLSENSRPAWTLVSHNRVMEQAEGGEDTPSIVWVPTVESVLEDALLMIGLYVAEDADLMAAATDFGVGLGKKRLELEDDLTAKQRADLYGLCRALKSFPKLAISVFQGSTLGRQLSVLEHYGMDVEICPVAYSRFYSEWRQETVVEGSLAELGTLF